MTTNCRRGFFALLVAASCLAAFLPASSKTSGVVRAPALDLGTWERFTPNQNGEPPSDLVAIAPGLLAIVDHVSGIVVFANETGEERGRGRLPTGFRVNIVHYFPERTVMIDRDGARKIVLPRRDQSPTSLPEIRAVPVRANDPDTATPRIVKRSNRRLGVQPQSGAGVTMELEVRAFNVGMLAAATFLGIDRQGRAYTLGHEIHVLPVAQRDGAQRSRIEATLTVGRHDRSGVRREVAYIPVDKLYKVPRGEYVAIDRNGEAIALLPMMDQNRKPVGVRLYRPEFVPEEPQVAVSRPLRAAAATLRALIASEANAVSVPIPNDAPDVPVVEDRDIAGETVPGDVRTRRSLRDMQEAAAALINESWTVSSANLAAGRQVDCDFNDHNANRAYELPHQLKSLTPGARVNGVPYNWGGKISLARFRAELAEGFRAGNICSQVGHKLARTTGLDCSGFVAQVWGVNGFGTAEVHRYSVPLADLNELRWGDVFNRPGKHIRLYVSDDNTPEEGLRINTIESSSVCGGTCALSYHVEHFHGYEIRRFSRQ
jgi:hypothetical protein